ncbi:MAG: hypothetical protein F6K19_20170 [Cyanothece sp. SIO1E1]|nr:hypothetical protein [Cyanothece sp. SIO1E1]
MKAIFFCGHLSPFGWSTLQATLNNQDLEASTIVFASVERWMSFKVKLKRGKPLANRIRFRRDYKLRTQLAIQEIKAINPRTQVLFTEDANDESIVRTLGTYEIILSAAFPQIFSNNFLQFASDKAVNFHPSFLPRCRGAHPVYWTIAAREPFGGLSSHLLTDKLDAGKILARHKIVFNRDTIQYAHLYDMINQAVPSLLAETLAVFQKQKKPPTLDAQITSSFHRENQEEDQRIRWGEEDFELISAKIRAGRAFCFLADLKRERLELFPPVSYQQFEVQQNSRVKVISQQGETIGIQCQLGLFYARFAISHPKKNSVIHRLLRKIDRYFTRGRNIQGEYLT